MTKLTTDQQIDLERYLRILAEGCSDHPAYRAKRRPSVKGCIWCDAMYMARQLVAAIDERQEAEQVVTFTPTLELPKTAKDLRSEKELRGGERLAHWLRSYNLSQSDVAERLNVSQPTLGRYLKGKSIPSAKMASKIATITDGFMSVHDW